MKPKYISDEMVLMWILSGIIRITHIHTRRPRMYFKGRLHKASIVRSNGKNHSPGGAPRYRWELCNGKTKRGKKRRRTIVCAKLIWMYAFTQTVPDGKQIHHRDTDSFNDSIDNLTDLTSDEHKEEHYGTKDDEVPF